MTWADPRSEVSAHGTSPHFGIPRCTARAQPRPTTTRGSEALAAPTAAAALAAGDFEGYRDCFAQAAELDDPNRRYYAQRALIEQASQPCAQRSRRAARVLLATSRPRATDVLEQTPAEPVLLNYAGVALYELWSLDAAQALFRRPNALTRPSDVGTQPCRVQAPPAASGPPLGRCAGVIPALARRAQAVAETARPAMGCA